MDAELDGLGTTDREQRTTASVNALPCTANISNFDKYAR